MMLSMNNIKKNFTVNIAQYLLWLILQPKRSALSLIIFVKFWATLIVKINIKLSLYQQNIPIEINQKLYFFHTIYFYVYGRQALSN